MICSLDKCDIKIEYTESPVAEPILWESHCHAQYEMIAVAEGDITVLLEGQNYRLKKNQILIIPPLCYHSVTANEKGIYRRITALFGVDAIPNVLRAEFTKTARNTECSSKIIDNLKEFCQKENASFYAPLIQSFIVQIFYDSLMQTENSVRTETDEFLQKALKYIDEHLSEKILLDDLARYTARSKSSFCHLFEKKMNISPKQYILQKKLAVASKLIDEGIPNMIVAMQVGYENYSNFYRLYNKASRLTNK
ncbi:MAG: AraC family transcriptional regulator [Ruminococcaceae bacterium]|nr:AraC family transcriptional regulator [Oscillospiraceae bacterium]